MKECEIVGCNKDGWDYIKRSKEKRGTYKMFVCREHYNIDIKKRQNNYIQRQNNGIPPKDKGKSRLRHVLIYLAFMGLLIAGLVLVANPYQIYILRVCVTYADGHTSCYNEVVRSFKFPLFFTGVVGTITSIGNIIAYTIVIIVIRSRKKRRNSIVNDVTNK